MTSARDTETPRPPNPSATSGERSRRPARAWYWTGLSVLLSGTFITALLTLIISYLFSPFVKETAGAQKYVYLGLVCLALDFAMLAAWGSIARRVDRANRGGWLAAMVASVVCFGVPIGGFLLMELTEG